MNIDCIGCLHGNYPKLEGGDLLIVTGDLTARDYEIQYLEFGAWLSLQDYDKKILIAGNHDNFFVKNPKLGCAPLGFEYTLNTLDSRIEYLCNSGTEFEGIKIWGTPHSLLFDGVNPKCTAFMGTEEELKEKYDLIPNDIHILISHTPPYGILDQNIHGEHCGSISLRNAMMRVKPKLIICGHIHEQGSKEVDFVTTKVINCSHVNERYKPVHKPITFTWGK